MLTLPMSWKFISSSDLPVSIFCRTDLRLWSWNLPRQKWYCGSNYGKWTIRPGCSTCCWRHTGTILNLFEIFRVIYFALQFWSFKLDTD